MKYISIALLGAMLLSGTAGVHADPEDERTRLVNVFKTRFPGIKPEEYVHGALALDPDGMAQYRSIMQFPPFVGELEKGERLWKTPLRNGKTYADCLPNGGRMIAGNYPLFDKARGRVVTLEDVVNECRVASGEEAWEYGDPKTMGLLTATLRRLSDGMRMNIQVEGEGALKAFEDGRQTFYRRVGQLNFSCASCHRDHAGNRMHNDVLSPVIGQATHWPVFRGGDQLETLQKRYQACYRRMRHVPDKPGSARFNNLEYFHSYLSNGLEMQSSVFRR